MKALNSREILTAPLLVKIFAFALTSIAFFYLGKHWSESDGYQPLPFFSSRPYQPSISISPNANKQFDISSLISNQSDTPQSSDSTLLPPPPPDRFGIVDENGTMTNNFDVGSVGSDPIENLDDGNSTAEIEGGNSEGSRVRLARFQLCNESMSEYIPCLDNVEAIRKLKSTEKGEKYERHCPEEGKGLDCLVPPPKGYQMPIPWPQSRDEVNFFVLRITGGAHLSVICTVCLVKLGRIVPLDSRSHPSSSLQMDDWQEHVVNCPYVA